MNQHDSKLVIVGINGSRAALSAAIWAVDEALSRQLPLRLVYVIPSQGERHASARAVELELERAETVLSAAEGVIQAERKPIQIETAVRSGDPGQVLVDESADAALVCVGTARRGPTSDGLLGPTAAALVAGARCPVAIIRTNPDGSPARLGVITVVLDDDPGNDEVVHQAMEEGRRRHATVRQVDRRVDSWVRRYPDVPVEVVAAGAGARSFDDGGDNRIADGGNVIGLAVVGEAEAAELPGLVTPNCHPILGYPDCSVLLVRHGA